MNDIEKRARELLAAEYDSKGKWFAAECIRNSDPRWDASEALGTIIAALTPPEGYVLVPVEPTPVMTSAGWDAEACTAEVRDIYAAMLAARPEVSP